jgi:hypothetical protein
MSLGLVNLRKQVTMRHSGQSVSSSTVSRSPDITLDTDRKCEDLLHAYLTVTLPDVTSADQLNLVHEDFRTRMDDSLSGENTQLKQELIQLARDPFPGKMPVRDQDNKVYCSITGTDTEFCSCRHALRRMTDLRYYPSHDPGCVNFIFTFSDGSQEAILLKKNDLESELILNHYLERNHGKHLLPFPSLLAEL